MTKILMPSGKIITPDSLFVQHRFARNNLDIEAPSIGLSGEFRFIKRRADGSVVQETPFGRNLILNAGLDRYGTGDLFGFCSIGTSNTAPANGQTGLLALAATTQNLRAQTTTQATASPWWGGVEVTYRFDLGSLNGNYSEIGIGWSSSACFSRALIMPDGVNPAAITVLADEQLDVVYRLRCFAPTADATGNIILAGNTIGYTVRAAQVTSPGGPGWGSAISPGSSNPGGSIWNWPFGYESGALGAVTDELPSGSGYVFHANDGPFTQSAYTGGSYQRAHQVAFNIGSFNSPSGNIQTMQAWFQRFLVWQYRFSPTFNKGPTRSLRLDFNTSWARRP